MKNGYFTQKTSFFLKPLLGLLLWTTALIGGSAASAQTITQWNFNSSPPDANASTGTINPSTGSGTASLVGGTTATFASGDANGGSTDPTTGSPTDDSGWNITTFAAQGASDESRGIQFLVSTVGQQNIVVKWDQRHSNTSSRYIRFQYTTDGTTWTNYSPLFEGTAGDTWFNNRTADLSSIAAVNNNPNFGFRIVAAFAPGTSAYATAGSGSTYGTAGTWRFDMVTVSSAAPATPSVNLSVSSNTGTEAAQTAITVTATASAAVSGNQTVGLAVTGSGITAGDYTLSNTTITITGGSTIGSVTFTVVDDADAEGNETATLTIASPSAGITLGSTVSQNVAITDNDVVSNTAPSIVADNETTLDPEKVTAFLRVPDNSPATSPAAFVSGVISDPTDPARTIGIEFNVTDAETPAGLTVTTTSSNTAVVTTANLVLTGTGASRNLKITPTGVGYSDVTVTVNDGSLSSSYVIRYAASAASGTPTTTRFHTGVSDASTAQAVDASYAFVADDENQVLRLYDRANSGLPVATFDFGTSLGLAPSNPEVDIESSTQIGARIYWLGSHSNSSGGNIRPNRYRLFATDVTGSGASATLSYVGRFDGLRSDLLAWDAANGHGLGANYLGLTASAAAGVAPESAGLDGFNIEGLTVAPDGSTGYLGFRAPILPTTGRTQALIIPWTNFTSLVSGNPTSGTATFGAPIFLDLGGRGIREIKRSSGGEYLIAAGPSDGATGTAPKDFRLYTWTGNAADAPVLRSADLTALNAGGSFESIVDLPATLTASSQIQLLVDNGDAVFYGDGTIAKDLPQGNFKKFRSELVTLGAPLFVKIHDIQGSGITFNPAFGGTRIIEGIVTRAFLGSSKLNGFFVQEEDADADADPATSEGISVFDPAGLFSGNEGDKVRITGNVVEFTGSGSSLTQLNNLSSVVNLGAGTLPSVTNVQLPVSSVADFERYEGMLVNLSAASGNLTVTEHFELGRFGQVLLSATGASNQSGTDARLDQYTQFNAPSISGNTAYLADLAKRQIILDDGRSTQNPDPILFGRGGNPLSATNTLRGGDEVASLTGPLDERFGGYRVQINAGVNFTPANPRPATAPAVGGTLKVASANVLNYFNGDGSGGGFPTSRGADNPTEFNRQRAKVLAALNGLGADVIGLNEVENDGYGPTSAIQDLVDGLNALAGAGTYAFVNPGVSISTDQITVGMLYKPARVTLVGAAATIPGGTEFDVVGRKPLAQTFQQTSTGAQVTVVSNHFKSKGSASAGTGNADIGDGQGQSNGTRTRQAQALATWLATNPTGTTDPDYLIVGDLNAYAKEDPLTTLATAGYSNLLPITSYSYVFDGLWGSLDHALGSSSLTSQVAGAEKWHINADEPTVLDYNTEFKSAGQVTSLYNADQFRASDHDPVLVGLNLTVPITYTLTPSSVTLTQGQTLSATTIATVNDASSLPGGATVTASASNNGVSVSNIALNASTGVITADVAATCTATNAGFTLTLNGSGAATAPTATLNVTVNALTLSASISGGGSACAGGSVSVSFSGTPNATVTYTLNGGSNQTIPLNGSGSASLSATASGTYALVSVSLGECSQAASGSVSVTIGSALTASISGGGSACAGGSVSVSFSGTPNATVTYTLNGGSNQTIPLNGSGSASLSATASGTYALVSVSLGECSQAASGSVSVTIGSALTASISGGGSACAGGSVAVSFSGTPNATVTYTLNGGSNQTIPLNGSGSASLSATASGTYALVSVSLGECSQAASGSVSVTIGSALTASISGGGSACAGGSVAVSFSGTPNATVTYTLNGGSNQTIPLNGSGSASLSATASGTYALVSVSNGTCSQNLSGSVVVTITPSPSASISGTTTVCVGNSTTIGFSGTPNATVTYTVNSGSNQTITLNGSGTASVSTGNLSASATYTLVSASLNGCSGTVSGSATVTVGTIAFVGAPTLGNAAVCAGQNQTVTFALSSSCPASSATFTAQLSDASGGFGNPASLGTVAAGSTAVQIPANTPVGAGYRIRIVSSNPAITSEVSAAFRVNAIAFNTTPTVSSVPACAGGNLRVSFTYSSACPFPSENGFTAELSDVSGNFSEPTLLGAVAPGITTLALPYSLPTGSGYRIRIRTSTPVFFSNPSAAFTINAPGFSSTPTVSSDNRCPGEAVRLSFSVGCPFPAGSVFTVQLSDASGSFATPTAVGMVTPGLNNVVIPAGTPAGNGYRLRVVNSSNPALFSPASGGFKVKACGNTREIAPEETGLRVAVSPNPSPEGKLQITISGAGGQALNVELFNGTGLSVRQQTIERAGEAEVLTWDIDRQPQGLYLLRVSGAKESKTVKVIH